MGFAAEQVVDCRQVHGCEVLIVDETFLQPAVAPAFEYLAELVVISGAHHDDSRIGASRGKRQDSRHGAM